MSYPTWSWPASGLAARGIALAPYASGAAAGFAIADWTKPTVWPFVPAVSGGSFGSAIVLGSGPPGLAGIAQATASGVWALGASGSLWSVANGASGGTLVTSLPSSKVYTGLASPSGSAFPMGVADDGTVYGSGGTLIGTFGTVPAWGATASGSLLFSVLGSGSPWSIGTMTVAGVTGSIALPTNLNTPSALYAVPSGALVAAGWFHSTGINFSGANALQMNPANNQLVLAVTSGTAFLLTGAAVVTNQWTETTSLTGLANLLNMAWVPNGTQALATASGTNQLQVIGYSAGSLSLSQTLTVSGARAVGVTSDSLHALVAQSGQNTVMPLTNSAGTWATGVAVTGLTGIASVAVSGTALGAAAYASGIALLTLSGSTWTISGTVATGALGFTPSYLTYDPFGTLYAVGPSGIAMLSGATVMATGTTTISVPTGLAVLAGRIMVPAPATNTISIFGQTTATSIIQQSSTTTALGTGSVFAGCAYNTVFLAGTGTTQMFQFDATPYVLDPVNAGSVGFWTGGWTVATLGVGYIPFALTVDASGTAWVATSNNYLFSVSGNGSILTSGLISTYPGQASGVPLSISSLFASSGHIWGATALPGVVGALE